MPYDHEKQKLKNYEALENPQVGDYWQEMFCPYFVIVETLKGNKYRVLSCLGGPNSYTRKDEPNAQVDNNDGTWSFNYDADMVVDHAWIKHTVKYESIEGFVADVNNTPKTQRIVQEWRNHKAEVLRKEWEEKKAEWERFTGWAYLKDEVKE